SRRKASQARRGGCVRAYDGRRPNRADEEIVGDTNAVRGNRPLRQVHVRHAKRVGIGHRRTTGLSVDVVFHSEPLEAPLDGMLTYDVLHVSIDLVAITILEREQAKARSAQVAAIQRTATTIYVIQIAGVGAA